MAVVRAVRSLSQTHATPPPPFNHAYPVYPLCSYSAVRKQINARVYNYEDYTALT